jgi:glycosyltransferase involved in cell wall biosynthesis
LVEFTRNFGKEVAISAGLHESRGSAAIIADSDLQHPLELIPSFIDEWKKGENVIKGIVDRQVKIGDRLYLGLMKFSFEVVGQDKNTFSFKILFSVNKLMSLFEKYGKTPIPKYIKGVDLTENNLRKRITKQLTFLIILSPSILA